MENSKDIDNKLSHITLSDVVVKVSESLSLNNNEISKDVIETTSENPLTNANLEETEKEEALKEIESNEEVLVSEHSNLKNLLKIDSDSKNKDISLENFFGNCDIKNDPLVVTDSETKEKDETNGQKKKNAENNETTNQEKALNNLNLETLKEEENKDFKEQESKTQQEMNSDKNEEKNEEESSVEDKEEKYSNKGENEEDDEDAENEEDLDEDEIKSSPAYIPKHGRFYMHDVRGSVTGDDEVEGNTSADDGEEQKTKRQSRADRKWQHDLYNDRMQKPKSSKERNRFRHKGNTAEILTNQREDKTTSNTNSIEEQQTSLGKTSTKIQNNNRRSGTRRNETRNLTTAEEYSKTNNHRLNKRHEPNHRFKTHRETSPSEKQNNRFEKHRENFPFERQNRFETRNECPPRQEQKNRRVQQSQSNRDKQQKILEGSRRSLPQRHSQTNSENEDTSNQKARQQQNHLTTNSFNNYTNGVRTIVSSRFRPQALGIRNQQQQNPSSHYEEQQQNTSRDRNNFTKLQGRFQRSNENLNRNRQNLSRFQNNRENNDYETANQGNRRNRFAAARNYVNAESQQQQRFNTNNDDLRNVPSLANRNNTSSGGAGKRYSSQRHAGSGINNVERFEQQQQQYAQQKYDNRKMDYQTNQYNNAQSSHRNNNYDQQHENSYYSQQHNRGYHSAAPQMQQRYNAPLRTDIPPPQTSGGAISNGFVDGSGGYTASTLPSGTSNHYVNGLPPQQGSYPPHMLQPTNVMYFDPSQQQQQPPSQMLATRPSRLLHIAPPEQN